MTKIMKRMVEKPMLLSVLLLIVTATISGCAGPKETITPEGKVSVEESGSGPDWCKAGMKITSSGPQGQAIFTVKGITTYEGKEVCQAEWNSSDEGVMTEYFNNDSSYMHFVIKDKSGNIIQQMDLSNPSTGAQKS